METVFKTQRQIDREAQDKAIYIEYNQMIATPGRSKIEVKRFLAHKYNFYSISAIYDAIKREEKRLNTKRL